MASNWIDQQSPFFYHQLRKRLIEYELPFCDNKRNLLNTDAAKEILNKKKRFIENFIIQLTGEIGSDDLFVDLLRTPSA